MIVFSAFCPHTPVLIPSVGKENIEKIKKTADSYRFLEQHFYTSKPDTIILLSTHGLIYDDAFSINLCDRYYGDFEEFGEFSTKAEFRADYMLIERIQRHMRDEKINFTMDTCEKLDHGAMIPLYLLSERIKNFRIVPINTSRLSLNEHFKFGQELKEMVMDTNKRVAVVASGDLSHALSTEAPAGFNEHGPEFDRLIQEHLPKNSVKNLLKISSDMMVAAQECGLRSLITLLGALDGVKYEPQLLSYEAPFGVGYLTCHFDIK